MEIILFIIGCVLAAGALGLLVYNLVTLIKSPMIAIDFKALLVKYGAFAGVFVVGITLLCVGVPVWLKWNVETWEWLCIIFGSFFTSLFLIASLITFLLHYYGKNVPEILHKWFFRILVVCFPLGIVMIFVLSNGYAYHLTYPLINGIAFNGTISTPANNTANIAFYALCILSGAIYVYLLCDHKFYVQYGKHGILESTFITAFPAGIIGARIFYVIGNWTVDGFDKQPWKMFFIWEGGLTILGGALTGIIVGVAWFLWRNKKYSIWLAVDIIVPSILLAQAVGRWGNFFNCEVHGVESSIEYWRWLPIIVQENAKYSSSAGWASEGNIFVPLFFIESIANMLGFFVLSHLFGNKLRKYTQFGDLAFGYLIWYGFTRVFMEPLRHTSFNMGDKGYWSWIWSIGFIVGGVLLIAGNHVIRFFIDKKKGLNTTHENTVRNSIIQSALIVSSSIALISVSAVLIAGSSFVPTLALNNFNIGLVLLFTGTSLLLFIITPILKVIERAKFNKTQQNG